MERRDTLPEQGEVHVWFVELAAGAASVEACFHCLSADERERASRFCFEHLRTYFTLSKGILRVLLGRYLSMAPARIGFAAGPRGKPRLTDPETQLEFNLAHSGNFAAYAFAVGCQVGVDIEEVRPVPDQEGIVRRFFSPEECAEWLGLTARRSILSLLDREGSLHKGCGRWPFDAPGQFPGEPSTRRAAVADLCRRRSRRGE